MRQGKHTAQGERCSGERTLLQARAGYGGGTCSGHRGAFRDVLNCLLRILPCKRLLSRSLGFDAFVFLLVPTSYVSLPQVQCARLLCRGLFVTTPTEREGASAGLVALLASWMEHVRRGSGKEGVGGPLRRDV